MGRHLSLDVRIAQGDLASLRSHSRGQRWPEGAQTQPEFRPYPAHSILRLSLLAKVIGPLTDGGSAGDSFNIVIPSMPGCGFSGKPRERGFNQEPYRRHVVQLMATGVTPFTAATGAAKRMALEDAAHVTGLRWRASIASGR